MKRILIITGPGGDAQGWGDLNVTKTLCEALNAKGKSAEIAYVKNRGDFMAAINDNRYDIVWSALYHISDKADMIGLRARTRAPGWRIFWITSRSPTSALMH